jgi:hypothetical protein
MGRVWSPVDVGRSIYRDIRPRGSLAPRLGLLWSAVFFISPEIFLLDFVHFFTIAHAGVVVKSPYEPRKVLSLFSPEDIYRRVPKYPVRADQENGRPSAFTVFA